MQNQRSVLPSMLALPRGGTTAPTTPLLRFIIAYAQPKVNMRAKLLPYANRKADTETAAQAVRCARTAQAVRPVRAGSFAVNHSGELPLRAAGAQEGRQPAVFHPLVNLPFSLLPWVQMVDCVSRKRTRQSGYLSVSFSAFSQFTDSVLLHMRVNQRRVRHDSAAQLVSLEFADSTYGLGVRCNLSSQVPCVTTCQGFARHGYVAPA